MKRWTLCGAVLTVIAVAAVTPAPPQRCGSWDNPNLGPLCNASTVCCGGGTMEPQCIAPPTAPDARKCCQWRWGATTCAAGDTCCGWGTEQGSTAACCPAGTKCCGTAWSGGRLCIDKDAVCCGGGNIWSCPANYTCGASFGVKGTCFSPTVVERRCTGTAGSCGGAGCRTVRSTVGCSAVSAPGAVRSVLRQCRSTPSRRGAPPLPAVMVATFNQTGCNGFPLTQRTYAVGRCYADNRTDTSFDFSQC
jgi:hypothetical protein